MIVKPKTLFAFAAYAASLGGAMRIAAAFIPYTPETAWLEIFYAVIDVFMLVAMLAILFRYMNALGLIGVLAAASASLGFASLIGPDPVMFGIDFYQLGAGVIVISVAVLSLQLLRAGILREAACLWLISFVFAIAFAALSAPVYLVASGVAFGTGFIAAGLHMQRGEARS